MCSGRVDPTFVLKALALGADGVMIAGCHPGECHYIEQNYKAMRRYAMLKHTLRAMGVEPDRAAAGLGLGRRRAAAGRGHRQAGRRRAASSARLNWPANWQENGERLEALEEIVKEHAEAMEVPA